MEHNEILKAMTVEAFLKKQSYEFKYNYAAVMKVGGKGIFHTRLLEMRDGEEKEEWAEHWYRKESKNSTRNPQDAPQATGKVGPIYYSEKMLEEAKRRAMEKK